MVIVGFGILFGLSHRNIFTFVSSLMTTIIGTHLFYSIIGLLAYVLLKEFGEKYILIYDKFEERKERVMNIHKPEGAKLYIVTTDKGVYDVDISNGNVFIGDKKEEKVKNNTETKDDTETKIKQNVISILSGDTVETKVETKKKRRKITRRRPNIR